MADPTAGITPPGSSTGGFTPSSAPGGTKTLYERTLERATLWVLKQEASYDRMLKKIKEINKETAKGSGGAAKTLFSGSNVDAQVEAMMAKLNEKIPASGLSRGARFGLGAGKAALGAAAFTYSTLPNVQDAVSQRIAAQGVASMVGVSNPQTLINSSNAKLTGGMTGQYSAQLAMGTLAGVGVLPGQAGYNNIMGQTAGLSVLTGMGNEQVAGAFGGINGMNFLRLGVRARDARGNLRKPGDIANDLYRRTFGNRKLTQEQMAQSILAPGSRAQQAIQAAAGGNQDLANTLTEQLYFQARNGGKKLDLSAKNVKDKILKLAPDDPMRKLYTYNERQAKYLQQVGGSEVGGYGSALDASGKVAEGMTALAKALPDVVGGMARLAGFLQTMPSAGNTGLAVAGGVSGLASTGVHMLGMYAGGKALTRLLGGGKGTGFLKGAWNFVKSAATKFARAPKVVPVLGGDSGASYTPTTWAQTLLKDLSITKNDQNVPAIERWEAQEGGHWNNSAKYNPLNTTLRMSSKNKSMNSSGVKIYSSWQEGFKATVNTLRNTKNVGYDAILSSLSSGSKYDVFDAIVNSKWGTKTLPKDPHTTGVTSGVTKPTGGGITARFGQKPKGNYWKWRGYHTGQDYGVSVGTSVKAYKAGTVEAAGPGGSIAGVGEPYGNVVLVNHGTHKSLYAHLSKVEAKVGKKVRSGQQIGLSGQSGSGARGAHLHFEIRKGRDGKGPIPVNPSSYLSGAAGSSASASASAPVVTEPEKTDSPVESTGSGRFSTSNETVSLNNFTSSATGVSTSISKINELISSAAGNTGSSFRGTGGDMGTPPMPLSTSMASTNIASSVSNQGRGVTINMNINIAQANTIEAAKMAQEIKTVLERELRDSAIRNY